MPVVRAAAHNDMRQASEAAGKYTSRASVPRWDSDLIDGPMLILKTNLMTKSPCEYNVCIKLI